MEITRDAVLRIVSATRETARLEEIVRQLTFHGNGDNAVNPILGTLLDVIFEMTGETSDVDSEFERSMANQLIYNDELTDEEVTDRIIELHERSKPKMPKPHTVNRDQYMEMIRKFSGYKPETPEGEWK